MYEKPRGGFQQGFKRLTKKGLFVVITSTTGVTISGHMDGDHCENDSGRQRHHSNE